MMRAVELAHDEHGELIVALSVAKLPASDIELSGRRFFRFESNQGDVLGFGGLEGDGGDILLRSVVVTAPRGQGTGGAILSLLEAQAKASGAHRLHILTNSAAEFFAARGYRVADRATAPPTIATSAQFAGLCPASATYLIKSLTE